MPLTPGPFDDDPADHGTRPHPSPQPPPYAPPARGGYGYAPQQPYAVPVVPMAPPTNGVATAGGVCGIVAAAISWIPVINFFSLVLSILAVALGGVGWKRANTLQSETGRPTGRGMAITGVVIGALGLVIALAMIAALGSALSELSNTPTSTQ